MMSVFNSIRGALLTPARRERLAYFRAVPARRLLLLAAAAFFVFCVVGFLSVMMNEGAVHLASGFSWALMSGLLAILYIVVLARKPALLPVLIGVQLLANLGLTTLMTWINRAYPPVPFERATHIYTLFALVCTVAGYTFFLVFIQTEGRFAFRAQTELALALGIQQTLVPIIDVVVAGCEIYGISVPSEKVGGDLVDVVSLPDGSAVAYVADIAGHGLQAGILMGMVKAAARTSLLDVPRPEALFDSLNRVLPGVKEDHMYATCAALRLSPEPDSGCRVDFALAGHPAILHLSAAGQAHDELTDQQFPLGILSVADYRSHSMVAAPGDLLVAATDGVLEVCGKDGVELGTHGLQAIVASHSAMPLADLAQKILAAARAIGPQDDDRTLLLIRIL